MKQNVYAPWKFSVLLLLSISLPLKGELGAANSLPRAERGLSTKGKSTTQDNGLNTQGGRGSLPKHLEKELAQFERMLSKKIILRLCKYC